MCNMGNVYRHIVNQKSERLLQGEFIDTLQKFVYGCYT